MNNMIYPFFYGGVCAEVITAPLLFVFSLGYKIDWFGFSKVEDLRDSISTVSFSKSGYLLHKVVLRNIASSYIFRLYVFVAFKNQRKFLRLCLFWVPELAFSLAFAFLSIHVYWLLVSGHLAQHLLPGYQLRDRLWTFSFRWRIKQFGGYSLCLLHRGDYLTDSQCEISSSEWLQLFVQTNVLPGCCYLQGGWVGAVLSIFYFFLNFYLLMLRVFGPKCLCL